MYKQAEENTRMHALKAPIHANFEITKRCNHLCGHCYNGLRDGPVSEEYYPPEHFKQIMQKLCEWGIFSVAISGGEPFLREDAINEILPVAVENNLDICINSNLTYMPPADILKDNPYVVFLTSIFSSDPKKHDAITRREGSLRRTLITLDKIIKENHNSIGINCVVTKDNLEDLYETGKLASAIGASSFSVTAMIPAHTSLNDKKISPEETKEMLFCLHKIEQEFGIHTDTLLPIVPCLYWDIPELRKYFSRACSAGKGSMNITPSGNISTCFHYTSQPENILTSDLNQVWINMNGADMPLRLFDECNNCALAESCNGGCKKDKEYLIKNLNPKPILSKPIRPQEIPNRFKVSIEKDIKFRKEEGIFLLYRRQKIAEVSENTLDIIQNAQEQGILDLNELNRMSRTYSEIKILLKEGFITIGGI